MKTFFLAFILLLTHQILWAQTPVIKWWYDVFDSSYGQSAAGDIDKDGKLEVVFGCYRNDSSIYALNADDGTLLWKHNASGAAEGCNDVAVAIYDMDNDDSLEVIVPSSCNPKTFCFRGRTGAIQWQANTAGSDSPPTIADIDNDGKAEILHGGFNGHVLCLNSEDGSMAWDKTVFSNSWTQTAPTLVDLNNDGQLDFVVGTWAFSPDTSAVYAFDGATQNLMWSTPVSDYTYHGFAVADLDNDGKPELVVGDYNGMLYVLNGEDGSLLWDYQGNGYIGAPAAIADIDNDGQCEVLYCDGSGVGALSHTGTQKWYYNIPGVGNAFRGVAIAEVNGDSYLDIAFGAGGVLTVLNGNNGSLIWDLDLEAHIGKDFTLNHAPLIADFDQNGKIDIFIVGGKTDYPMFHTNYGRAYMIEAGPGTGPEWLMFQRDLKRQSSFCYAPVGIAETKKIEFSIAPNPALNQIQIQSNSIGDIGIYTLLGKKLFATSISKQQAELDISFLPAGMYILMLETKKGRLAKKIIKH